MAKKKDFARKQGRSSYPVAKQGAERLWFWEEWIPLCSREKFAVSGFTSFQTYFFRFSYLLFSFFMFSALWVNVRIGPERYGVDALFFFSSLVVPRSTDPNEAAPRSGITEFRQGGGWGRLKLECHLVCLVSAVHFENRPSKKRPPNKYHSSNRRAQRARLGQKMIPRPGRW